MNRILFESEEVRDGVVRFGGARAHHVVEVLHGEVGQILKTGEIDGKIGTSKIVEINTKCPYVTVEVDHQQEAVPSWMDLILSPPRPRVLKRLLPQLATMGVGKIVIVGASKLEKDFWGATILREDMHRPLLTEGLMQSCVSTEMPVVVARRNFREFVNDELEEMFPTANRVLAHPYADASAEPKAAGEGRLLMAVGPEGGWTDREVAVFENEHRFTRYSLGPRILRTDTALIALLARFMGK